MSNLDHSYHTESERRLLAKADPHHFRLRISVARYTATLKKLERVLPEHATALGKARRSALRLGRE